MRIVVSTEQEKWREVDAHAAKTTLHVGLAERISKDFKGFGCCFNELGWTALEKASAADRSDTLAKLFAEDACNFSYCRVPIGASDYATSWYSHNETPGDFDMRSFSIARDHEALIPYIRAAQEAHGAPLTLFASAWSPPTWMKFPSAYNFGTLIWEDDILKAYALYLAAFVKAYGALEMPISAVHVQNEPDSDQKFPSCRWTGEQMRDFLRDYLAPRFEKDGLDTALWLGTIERGDFGSFILPTLADPKSRAAISGIGLQWAGKAAARQVQLAAPDLDLIQTENECGDGSNSWEYAHYVFDLARHYLDNGASAYVYWNAVLETGGLSTWGWHQNSMFTVAPETGAITAEPEYYVMRHLANFVRPGAEVLRPEGSWAGNSIGFRNADGKQVIALHNPLSSDVAVSVALGGETVSLALPPRSFATAVET